MSETINGGPTNDGPRQLGEDVFRALIRKKKFAEIAATAISIESRTNLLFSFEKIVLRDAVRPPAGAKIFAVALFDLLHGAQTMELRFGRWVDAIGRLPRRKTRVLTWPLVTVFGFIAEPRTHFFLKPTVTREAAAGWVLTFPTDPVPHGRSIRTC